MDGENNGKPYEQMDDLGVPLFSETSTWILWVRFPKTAQICFLTQELPSSVHVERWDILASAAYRCIGLLNRSFMKLVDGFKPSQTYARQFGSWNPKFRDEHQKYLSWKTHPVKSSGTHTPPWNQHKTKQTSPLLKTKIIRSNTWLFYVAFSVGLLLQKIRQFWVSIHGSYIYLLKLNEAGPSANQLSNEHIAVVTKEQSYRVWELKACYKVGRTDSETWNLFRLNLEISFIGAP